MNDIYFDGIRVGDSVYSIPHGEGHLVRVIPESPTHPLYIEFTDTCTGLYTLDGMENGRRVLFWQEPTIIDKGRPNNMSEYRPAVGEECLISGPNCDAEEKREKIWVQWWRENDTGRVFSEMLLERPEPDVVKMTEITRIGDPIEIISPPIPQPKRMVKKSASWWINYCRDKASPGGIHVGLYDTQEEADKFQVCRLGPAVFVEHTWEEEDGMSK